MGAFLEAARLHKPLPTLPKAPGWGPTDGEIAAYRKAGRLIEDMPVPALGAEFTVCWEQDLADEDSPHRCWCEAILLNGTWFWLVEVHSEIWRDALDEALTTRMDAAAAERAEAFDEPYDHGTALDMPCAWPGLAKLEPIL